MFMTRITRKNHIAWFVSLLWLMHMLGASCYAQSKDVLGWQDARWGMSEQDIVRVFSPKLKKLPKKEVFLGLHVDYVIPDFGLEGGIFTVFFQMDDATNKLSQILIRLNEQESRVPREQLFNRLGSLLSHEYGSPNYTKDERYSYEFKGIDLSRRWKFSTTTIELGYGWDSQIYASLLTIRYFPSKKDNQERRLTTACTRPRIARLSSVRLGRSCGSSRRVMPGVRFLSLWYL
jgi:hypothetical protein